MSSIPDEIVQQFHEGINGSNFQTDFLEAVKRYRQKFERRFGSKWEFQNRINIQRYIAFKRKRQGVHLNPSYQTGRENRDKKKLIDIDQSFYVSEVNKSREGSTDAFTGLKFGDMTGAHTGYQTGSGFLSPSTEAFSGNAFSGRANLRGILSQATFN